MDIIPRRYKKEFNYALVITALIIIGSFSGILPFASYSLTNGFSAVSISSTTFNNKPVYRADLVVSQFNPDTLKAGDYLDAASAYTIDVDLTKQQCRWPITFNENKPIYEWDFVEVDMGLRLFSGGCPSDTIITQWCKNNLKNHGTSLHPNPNPDPQTILGRCHEPSGSLDTYYWCFWGEQVGTFGDVSVDADVYTEGTLSVSNGQKYNFDSGGSSIATDFGNFRYLGESTRRCTLSSDIGGVKEESQQWSLASKQTYDDYKSASSSYTIRAKLNDRSFKATGKSDMEAFRDSLNDLERNIFNKAPITNNEYKKIGDASNGYVVYEASPNAGVLANVELLVDIYAKEVGITSCVGKPSVSCADSETGTGGFGTWKVDVTNNGPGCGVFNVNVKCPDLASQWASVGTNRLEEGQKQTVEVSYKGDLVPAQQSVNCLAEITNSVGDKTTTTCKTTITNWQACSEGSKKCSGNQVLACDDTGQYKLYDTCEGAEVCEIVNGQATCHIKVNDNTQSTSCADAGLLGSLAEQFGFGCDTVGLILTAIVLIILIAIIIIIIGVAIKIAR